MDVAPLAVLTVALVALAYSGLDVLRKLLARRAGPVPLLVLLTLGSMPLFLVWAVVEGRWRLAPGYLLPGAGTLALNIVANLAFLQAVRVSPLSLTIPYLSLTPVFTTLLAVPLLGELPGPLQLLGIALVVTGAVWLNLPGGDTTGVAALGSGLLVERGSLLMIVTALCWSLAVPLDKLAIGASTPAVHALILMSGITLAGLALLAARRRLGELKVGRWRLVTAAVGVTAVGAALNFVALTMVWVGFIETFKRGLGSALALLWGRTVFAEPIHAYQLVAVALMGLGVALILR